MYRILKKESLNSTVTKMEIEAPFIAKKALAGQFVIVRADSDGERIPLTIAACDSQTGGVTIIFQVVGATTMELNDKKEGDSVADFVGPLGTPTHLTGLKKVAVVGGGVGCAIALPVARALKNMGAEVTSIVGFRSRDLVILDREFRDASDRMIMMTIGPLIMMKFVAQTTLPYGVKTVASMNPIMIDGTGMCGCCRVSVGGEMKFACVDGPDFDAHLIDFDEAMQRAGSYKAFETRAREKHCNLYPKGEN